MINKILGTTGTRMLNAAFNLLILIVLTRKLGSVGFGTISLIILAITILQLFIDLLAGSGIIYYTSRKPIPQLLFPAYGWILISASLYALIVWTVGQYFPEMLNMVIPEGFELHVLFLSILNALMLLHYNLLIGQTRIKRYNSIFVIQISVLLVSVILRFYLQNDNSVHAFIYSLYLSYGFGAFLSFAAISKYVKSINMHGWLHTSKAVFRYGFISQIANLLHIGNKRFSFYILRYFSGLPAVGIYGAGVQLTEGLRLIGQSISLVQFSSIAGQADTRYAVNLTVRLMKLSFIITLLALIILLIIPSDVYVTIFKKDFGDIKVLILALSPGLLALSINTIFSGYFAGVGRPKVSMIVNAIGFVVTLFAAGLIIPLYGYIGAAVAASLSYSTTVLAQYIIFKKETKTCLKDWLITKQDWFEMKNIVHILLKTNKLRNNE